ncbi:MAG: GNAT family N-acetyltransferase [Gemmatimonadota bacterium]|nr:GNAT family N-acetyltransferase [Gemmatimonadota bacterium]
MTTQPAPTPEPPANIGPAAAHEIDALAALMRAVIEPLGYYNARAKRAELMKYDADGLRTLTADDPAAVLVARDGARLVGFCVSRYDDATVWLSWFGTASDARGRGIGAALLAALGRTIPGRGAHKVWCDSRVENVESKAVLERAGFVRVATLTNHWFGQDFYLWEWYPNGTGAV